MHALDVRIKRRNRQSEIYCPGGVDVVGYFLASGLKFGGGKAEGAFRRLEDNAVTFSREKREIVFH